MGERVPVWSRDFGIPVKGSGQEALCNLARSEGHSCHATGLWFSPEVDTKNMNPRAGARVLMGLFEMAESEACSAISKRARAVSVSKVLRVDLGFIRTILKPLE